MGSPDPAELRRDLHCVEGAYAAQLERAEQAEDRHRRLLDSLLQLLGRWEREYGDTDQTQDLRAFVRAEFRASGA